MSFEKIIGLVVGAWIIIALIVYMIASGTNLI